jgi:hypothetical protein
VRGRKITNVLAGPITRPRLVADAISDATAATRLCHADDRRVRHHYDSRVIVVRLCRGSDTGAQ